MTIERASNGSGGRRPLKEVLVDVLSQVAGRVLSAAVSVGPAGAGGGRGLEWQVRTVNGSALTWGRPGEPRA